LAITVGLDQKPMHFSIRQLIIFTSDIQIGSREIFNFILKYLGQDLNKAGMLLSSMLDAKIKHIVHLVLSELPLAAVLQEKGSGVDCFMRNFSFSLMVSLLDLPYMFVRV
jgi:hypothetical protein